MLVILGVIVNITPLLATPPTVTTTFPDVAAVGTVTVMDPEAHAVDEAATPLNVTEFPVAEPPKPDPEIVTVAPTSPVVIDKPEMNGVTVNGTLLLSTPLA
jgi:hypothetical protein